LKRPFLLGYNVLTKKKTEGLEGIKEMRRYNIMLFKSKKKAEKYIFTAQYTKNSRQSIYRLLSARHQSKYPRNPSTFQ